LADLELKSGMVGKKIGKKKPDVTWLIRRVDLARPGQKLGCNPLTFILFFY
jgi:hypothetical protein